MPTRTVVLLLAAAAAFAADDPWNKVREVKSGAECRVFRTGGKPPMIVKLDEATDEHLLVVLKNEQIAIPREQVDRLECRPVKPASRLKQETKVTESETGRKGPEPNAKPGPTQNVSSSVSIEGKPDFELVYRRAIGGPKKVGAAITNPE